MANEGRFTGKADVYAAFRPSYPAELLQHLYSAVGFGADSTIADIGSGTGIFSRLLLERNSRVICVEPNGDMLAAARRELAHYRNCAFVNAPAEATTLGDGQVDFITVAQAFHWFDRQRFQAECRRILRRTGKVVLLWNVRDPSDALNADNYQINKRLCPGFSGFSGGSGGAANGCESFFLDGRCDCREFQNDLKFDEAAFIGRNLSSSYAPRPGSENYEAYRGEISALFQRYSAGGVLTMKNVTRAYIGRC